MWWRLSITKISERLKINKYTISWEIKRNSNFGIYDPEIANKKALNQHSYKYFFNNMKYAEFINLFLEFFKKNFFGINATYHCINIKFPKVKIKIHSKLIQWSRNLLKEISYM